MHESTISEAFYMVSDLKPTKALANNADWSDVPSQTILSVIRSAMGQESMILIDDHVVAEIGAHKTVMQMDMTMLLALGAEERTERRWRQLVETVGLVIERIYCYDEQGGDSIIVLKRNEGLCK